MCIFSLPIDPSNYQMYYGPSKFDAKGYVCMQTVINNGSTGYIYMQKVINNGSTGYIYMQKVINNGSTGYIYMQKVINNGSTGYIYMQKVINNGSTVFHQQPPSLGKEWARLGDIPAYYTGSNI